MKTNANSILYFKHQRDKYRKKLIAFLLKELSRLKGLEEEYCSNLVSKNPLAIPGPKLINILSIFPDGKCICKYRDKTSLRHNFEMELQQIDDDVLVIIGEQLGHKEYNIDMKIFGEVAQEFRENASLAIKKLADYLGIETKDLDGFEKGYGEDLFLSNFFHICLKFNKKMSDFAFELEKRKAKKYPN